jgi:hypothetical protein
MPQRSLLAGALGGMLLCASGAAQAKGRAWPCAWVHGRMADGNGTPSVRIWPSGTHRLLGVIDPGGPEPGEAEGALPRSVQRLLTVEHGYTVWGDFYVCPVEPRRPGWMRMVVVKSARRLFARRF